MKVADMGSNLDGSGVTVAHTIWGAISVAAATIVKANGWYVEKEGWKIRKAFAEISSGIAIYFVLLAVTAWFDLEPAVTGGVGIILTIIGLAPISAAVQKGVERYIERKTE